jgi:putative transposase
VLYGLDALTLFAGRAATLAAARTGADGSLSAEIQAAQHASRGRSGSPRVHADLRAQGRRVGRKRIPRLMRRTGLAARQRRRFRRTTDSRDAFPIAPNLIAPPFTAQVPDRVWLADITYIWMAESWLYLPVPRPTVDRDTPQAGGIRGRGMESR